MRIFVRMLLICWAVMLLLATLILLVPSATSPLQDDRQRTLPPLTLLIDCAQGRIQQSQKESADRINSQCPPAHLVATGTEARSDLSGKPLSIEEARLVHLTGQDDGVSLRYLPGATLIAFRSDPKSPATPIYLVSIPLTRRSSVMLNHALRLVFLAGLFALIVAAFFVRPVTRLSSMAQQFGDGDLKARVTPSLARRKDELGDLALTFNKMAERTETLIGNYKSFLAHASHELGSPLTRLNMALALAKRKAGAELKQEHDRIGLEADRLNRLVQEMLLLARLESGNELNRKPTVFDAALVAREAYENASFESQQSLKRITLTISGDFEVRGYPELLARAIDNVLRNGLRFARHQVRMQVTSTCRSDAAIGVILIEDDGPGIPKGREEEIFTPFLTISDDPSDDVPRGSGLGLAIAQQAVLANGGKIFAKGIAKGGLAIVIELPISSELDGTMAEFEN